MKKTTRQWTISLPEAARRIGCKPETLRAGIDNGTVPFGFKFKASREWVYKVAEEPLMKLLEGGGSLETMSRVEQKLDELLSIAKSVG